MNPEVVWMDRLEKWKNKIEEKLKEWYEYPMLNWANSRYASYKYHHNMYIRVTVQQKYKKDFYFHIQVSPKKELVKRIKIKGGKVEAMKLTDEELQWFDLEGFDLEALQALDTKQQITDWV